MLKKILMSLMLSLVFVLAACGGSEEDTGSDEGSEEMEENGGEESASGNNLDISATNFEFDQSEYTVEAGEEVTVNLTNEEGTHGIAIDEFDVNMEGEGSTTFTPEEPGEYTIECSVPCGEGHEDMQSTLIVE
ncbi:cytochrome C oxidase subunit II [Halobacillus sp. Marseille-P3879]|uniref:cytochrome C oxidase subunit II n=1 Tax=Halobacillus sp. Marseille-P3879 TaxID=2045014 RepID=UPI001F328834|nr:cytochrome C oxidase subunit II [Halobacillus sp. Marseille-P3879]